MIADPAATPVTTPVDELMVAALVLLDDHVPPTFPFEDKVVEPLEQIAVVPLIVPAFGAAVTVTVLVAVAFEQPPVPVTVYVMIAEPADTADTAPVDELIVATEALSDDHVPPLFPLVVNVVEPFEQIAVVPLMVPALGAAVTVTTL